MHNIKIPRKNKLLSAFNIIACSISKNFDNFQQRLKNSSYNKNIRKKGIKNTLQHRRFPSVKFAKFLRTPIL